ncbi:MAG TPA: hypothetical protein VER98_00850 [Terriglobia bacterium]|nr:hypothetical protein [Terriglobia bacterium]
MNREAAVDFSPGREPWERALFGTSSPERAAEDVPPFQGLFLGEPEPRAYALG